MFEVAPALAIAGILALGMTAHVIAWRFRIPLLVPFLALGGATSTALGLDLAGKNPMSTFASAAGVGFALILFDAGQGLQRARVVNYQPELKKLVAMGGKVGWLAAAFIASVTLGLKAPMALLLGALMLIQAPYAIRGLADRLEAHEDTTRIMLWESYLAACFGVAWSVLAANFLGIGEPTIVEILKQTVATVGVGAFCAVLCHQCLVWFRAWAPEQLLNPGTATVFLVCFGAAQTILPGAGALTAGLAGYLVAKHSTSDKVALFNRDLMILTTAFLGALFGLVTPWEAMAETAVGGGLFALALTFGLRPLLAAICVRKSSLPRREKRCLAMVAPRGLLTLAVTFLITLKTGGQAEGLVPIVYWVVLVSNLAPWLLGPALLGPPEQPTTEDGGSSTAASEATDP